jgi:RNA polymerase sigma-70 factor (ECF subfamily)
MFNVCVRMLGNIPDAEDIFQEAFVAAFKSLDQFKEEASFGSWLKRIMVNRCINALKARKKNLWLSIDDLGTELQEEVEEEKQEFDPVILNKAIENLPDGCRVVFTLHYFEGFTHGEISEILTISVSTSKSQLSRAKNLIKNQLKKLYHGQTA